MDIVNEPTPQRSEGRPALEPVMVKDPVKVAAVAAQMNVYKKFQRTAFKRNLHSMQRAGVLNGTATGENSSILDLLLGTPDKGLPLATLEHSIATKTIIELSVGLGSAAIIAGLILKKL